RGHAFSPVHLEPLDGSGRPTGYRHHGLEHLENSEWLSDILDDGMRKRVSVRGSEVRLPSGVSWWQGFRRDVCFRFQSVFFATEVGLNIDDDLVGILRDAQ